MCACVALAPMFPYGDAYNVSQVQTPETPKQKRPPMSVPTPKPPNPLAAHIGSCDACFMLVCGTSITPGRPQRDHAALPGIRTRCVYVAVQRELAKLLLAPCGGLGGELSCRPAQPPMRSCSHCYRAAIEANDALGHARLGGALRGYCYPPANDPVTANLEQQLLP